MTPDPYLSLVVPVHDGEAYLAHTVDVIAEALEALGQPYEVLVVCDGPRDATIEIAEAIDHPNVRVFHYPQNQGKGFAISLGLGQARGQLRGWLDADLDVHPDVIVEAARVFAEEDVDAVVGSKRHPRSSVEYPRIRRLYSWGFQTLQRVLFRLNVRDTQVGAKLFRAEMIDTVLPLLLIKRYAYDLEVLAVGAAFGFDRVREVPIRLEYRFTGSGINWRAVQRMFIDTMAIAYRIHLRHWYVRQFAAQQRERVQTPPIPQPEEVVV
jgi:glycosyltransferase involved in cell wall biosynthesis